MEFYGIPVNRKLKDKMLDVCKNKNLVTLNGRTGVEMIILEK
jgi:hypothetical protein